MIDTCLIVHYYMCQNWTAIILAMVPIFLIDVLYNEFSRTHPYTILFFGVLSSIVFFVSDFHYYYLCIFYYHDSNLSLIELFRSNICIYLIFRCCDIMWWIFSTVYLMSAFINLSIFSWESSTRWDEGMTHILVIEFNHSYNLYHITYNHLIHTG